MIIRRGLFLFCVLCGWKQRACCTATLTGAAKLRLLISPSAWEWQHLSFVLQPSVSVQIWHSKPQVSTLLYPCRLSGPTTRTTQYQRRGRRRQWGETGGGWETEGESCAKVVRNPGVDLCIRSSQRSGRGRK
jgi:hypothetical protein